MRVLGQFSIFGTKKNIDRLALAAPFPDGVTTQVGLKRRIPDIDSWCYATTWYSFHYEELDVDVRNFVSAHSYLSNALSLKDLELTFAFFNLCPVEPTDGERFSCILSNETLLAISNIKVDLQIAPALSMPDAPYWVRK